MTQQQSPDGQTQAPPQTQTDGGQGNGTDGEAWRNHADVKKIIAKRDEMSSKAREAQARADAAEAKLAEYEAARMKAEGNTTGLLEAERKKREEAEAKAAELSSKEEARARQDRRREIVDAILDEAHPQRKDELRLMLAGLHEAGDLDLYAEDAKAEGKKALDKLRKKMPAYFTPADARSTPSPRGPGRDLTGVQWMDLTPDEQRAVSAEDFRKHFAGRGGGGRKTSLFG